VHGLRFERLHDPQLTAASASRLLPVGRRLNEGAPLRLHRRWSAGSVLGLALALAATLAAEPAQLALAARPARP
jgi:hypothetical protein